MAGEHTKNIQSKLEGIKIFISVREHVPIEHLYNSGMKKREYAFARHLVMYFLHQTGCKPCEIQQMLGFKQHATIIHGIKTIKNLLQVDPKIRKKVQMYQEGLEGTLKEIDILKERDASQLRFQEIKEHVLSLIQSDNEIDLTAYMLYNGLVRIQKRD